VGKSSSVRSSRQLSENPGRQRQQRGKVVNELSRKRLQEEAEQQAGRVVYMRVREMRSALLSVQSTHTR